LRGAADVAFQRVAYFPAPITQLLGFAACSGFVYCHACPGTIAFLDDCLHECALVHDDQVAINLALLEADAEWPHVTGGGTLPALPPSATLTDIQGHFAAMARSPLRGRLRNHGLDVLALPHHQFWRHSWVAAPDSDMVVCHPNSPKDEIEKIKIFNALCPNFMTNPLAV
jgi:hypothetical protein